MALEHAAVHATTYQSLIRQYAHMVADGHSDTDLSKRERRMVQVMLNTAANDPMTAEPYGAMSPDRRERTVTSLISKMNDANVIFILQSLSETGDNSAVDCYQASSARTVAILHGI